MSVRNDVMFDYCKLCGYDFYKLTIEQWQEYEPWAWVFALVDVGALQI